jgi:hypothetical protein
MLLRFLGKDVKDTTASIILTGIFVDINVDQFCQFKWGISILKNILWHQVLNDWKGKKYWIIVFHFVVAVI